MLAYTVWGESGGIGKTTFTYNLASAHQRSGYNVLAIDMDTQDGGLTKHAGRLATKNDPEAEKFVEHLLRHPSRDSIEELIYTHPVDGFDIIPSHDSLRNFEDRVESMKGYYKDEDINPDALLQEAIVDNELHEKYDVIIVDPPAKTSLELRNALYATKNVIAPVEVSPKGRTSVRGLLQEREVLIKDMKVEIGLLGMIPNEVRESVNINNSSLADITSETQVGVAPVQFNVREALFGGGWEHEMSIFSFVEEEKTSVPDREMKTLKKMQYLADLLTNDVTIDDDPLEMTAPVTMKSQTTQKKPQPRDEHGNFISWEEAEKKDSSPVTADD